MNRGDVYLVRHPNRRDPKRRRPFVVVSRQVAIQSRFATVICAPIFTTRAGIATQVSVGVNEGLKQPLFPFEYFIFYPNRRTPH